MAASTNAAPWARAPGSAAYRSPGWARKVLSVTPEMLALRILGEHYHMDEWDPTYPIVDVCEFEAPVDVGELGAGRVAVARF